MSRSALKLGADTVSLLLPHRRPFLFVDGVLAYGREPAPALTAFKQISANEPVFEGHFPGLSLWPGVYTIEGLGQTVNVLLVLLSIIDGFERRELTEGDAVTALKSIDARRRLGGRAPSAVEKELVAHLGEPRARMGFAGAVDVKLIEPVFAGATLRYEVSLTHALSNARRFDVLATVDERPVARGSMTSALPDTFGV